MANTRRQSIREQRDELADLVGNDQLQAAIKAMHAGRDLEIVQFAIGLIARHETPDAREDLIGKYHWCQHQPHKRDGGAFIRAALVRALRPISGPEDAALFQQAIQTYEMDGPFEVCADLRAAGLLAMNDVHPDLAANFSARLILDPQITFSGEPANTAIALLASHANLAPIFGIVSWGQGRNDVIAEGLRNLTELPTELLPMLVELYLENEDEQIILGLFDLLLGHPSRDSWVDEIERWFRTTTVMDLYGIAAIQVVGSRSDVLIAMLRKLRANEFDSLRQGMLDQALELA